MGFILAFLGSRLGKYVIVGVGIVALLLGVYWYGRRSGQQAGLRDGAKQTADTLGDQMKQDRVQFATALASISSVIEKQNSIIDRQNAAISAREQIIAALEKQRKDTSDSISKLSDQAAVLDLAARLQIRDPKDVTPTLYPVEIRKADTIVADYAIQSQQFVEINGKIDAMTEKVAALEAKNAATEQKLGLAMQYIDRADERLRGAVQVIYHLHKPSLFKRIITFGIAREKRVPELIPIVPPERPKELAK